MSATEGYDVLRFIEHGQSCYVSVDYVKGRSLIQWLKYHPDLSKEQLFLWIHELARQLECIHKCRGNPCYQYVNPYSVIITEEKALYFLDMNAESNARRLPTMRRRNVREYFLPPEEAYYQNATLALDIYGLGRTIQYLLSVSELQDPLSRREELQLQKIISKSLERRSGRAYRQVSELRKQLPIYRTVKKIVPKKKIFLLAGAAAAVSAAVLIFSRGESASHDAAIEKEQAKGENLHSGGAGIIERQEKQEKQMSEESSADNKDLLEKELGFLYFLDKKDYERSREHFENVLEEAAQGMAELAEYMTAGAMEENEEILYQMIENVDEEISGEERIPYYRCLLEGCRLIDTREAAEAVIRLGTYCLEQGGKEIEEGLEGYLAAAYEKTGRQEQAAEMYMELLCSESGEIPREEIYKKLALLWEELGEKDKAGGICRQGIKELAESEELRLLHISMQCRDTELDREICAQTIQEYIREMPEIAEKQEFKKLVQEYGIVVEGEQVWVGR